MEAGHAGGPTWQALACWVGPVVRTELRCKRKALLSAVSPLLSESSNTLSNLLGVGGMGGSP